MALIMMSIMHFVIKWMFSCHPCGVHGNGVSFVGRGSIAFHRLPNPPAPLKGGFRRPYGTLQH